MIVYSIDIQKYPLLLRTPLRSLGYIREAGQISGHDNSKDRKEVPATLGRPPSHHRSVDGFSQSQYSVMTILPVHQSRIELDLEFR